MKKHLIFLLVASIFSSFSATGQSNWINLYPVPEIQNLNDVCFVNEQKGWVVGEGGLIQFTGDGGTTWETQHKNETWDENFKSVCFANENEGWVVGWGQIYHTTNAGQNWEKQTKPYTLGDIEDVFFIDEDMGWIVGYYKIILKTTDGGENWIKISNDLDSGKDFFGVYFTDALHGCAVGSPDFSFDSCYIMVTEDGGDTWVDTTPEDVSRLNDVYFINQDTGYACGYDGNIIKTTDGGYSWNLIYEDYGLTAENIYFFDDDHGIVTGLFEYAITQDGGETWTKYYIDNNMIFTGFDAANDTAGYVVGLGGLVAKTTDRGYNWEQIRDTVPHPALNNIGFFDALSGVTTSNNTLMVTDDGGNSWNVKDVGAGFKFRDLSLPTNMVGYVLSNANYKLVKTSNTGEDWSVIDLPVLPDNLDYTHVQFVNEMTGYVCGENGYVYRTEDGGHTWQDKSMTTKPLLTGMFFVNENLGCLISENGKVIKTVSGGNSYTFSDLKYNNKVYEPLDIFFVNEQVGYIATKESEIFKTEDGGDHWNAVSHLSAGVYNPRLYFTDDSTGWYKSTTKVFYTKNGGKKWDMDVNYFGTSLYDMSFLDANHGWVCGNYSFVATYATPVGIETTPDQNTTFTVFPNPARDQIIVSAIHARGRISQYQIYDLNGRLLNSSVVNNGQQKTTIDISSLLPGMYLIKVEVNGRYSISRFLKN